MLIYIRHGHDEKRGYRHDEELTESGKRAAREKAEQLLTEYGAPDVIYYSPFQRTRATKKEMVAAVKRYKKLHGITKLTRIIIEPRLGRYFNRHERRSPDIHPKTLKRGAITDEDRRLFKSRVQSHLREHSESDEIIWNITHTLVLIRVAKILNLSYSERIEYLDHLVIDDRIDEN